MKMRIVNCALLAASLAALAACDKSPQGGSTASASSPATAGESGSQKVLASAEEVAEEGRGKVRCPAKIKTPPRTENAPVDDVVGVRPGLTYNEAAAVVMCTHDLLVAQTDTSRRFNINTYGQTIRQGFSARFAEARVQKDSRDYLREMSMSAAARSGNAVVQDMQPGQSKWYVSTMGLPGQERVIAAAREEWFEAGRNPTMDSIEQALLKKYGTPTQRHESGGMRQFTWAYDPLGRLITETSPLYHQCRGSADPDGGTNFSPDCGVVVAAMAHPTRENPGLGQYLQVGVIDQANGYEAITGTEQALAQLDEQRKAKELQSASQNADAPDL